MKPGILVTIVGAVVVGVMMLRADKAVPDVAAPPPPAMNCKTDWQLCNDNSDLVNSGSREYSDARHSCKWAAEEMARYGTPDWGTSWLGFGPFTWFSPGSSIKTEGTMTLVEKEAKFQNGFGAMAHVNVRCRYNFKTQTVEDMNISQR